VTKYFRDFNLECNLKENEVLVFKEGRKLKKNEEKCLIRDAGLEVKILECVYEMIRESRMI
jgi:hypothetical protein